MSTLGKMAYYFGPDGADGSAKMKNLLGGKGANLAEMTSLGIPVPPGFTISTEVCVHCMRHTSFPEHLREQVAETIAKVEKAMGKRYGDSENPLLLSVRSGARVSMPGMMDTVLNIGLNDQTVLGVIRQSENPRFAYDSYRRFVQMYGDVVLGVDREGFEHLLEQKKHARGVSLDTELTADDLKALVAEYKAYVLRERQEPFPEEPVEQLWGAISAVFNSWKNERAASYRRLNGIPDTWGTAVNVQAMVFGNLGNDSGTGVAFTRDPSTGDKRFYGEYLINAQGEDVVAGIRTPQPINKESDSGSGLTTLEDAMPGPYAELVATYQRLEGHYGDMQDLEFTIERGKLWLLQTRNGKRTARAALKIAADMVDEGRITPREAVMRIDPQQLDQLLHPMLDPNAPRTLLAKGLPASPGAATGKIVFTADEAVAMAGAGERVILVRSETSPEDINGMATAQGILTARGGMTSHAAVVARGMGKCCVAGCGDLRIDQAQGMVQFGQTVLRHHDLITLDGGTGEVFLGEIATVTAERGAYYERLMTWVDEFRSLRVRTNADTPHDAEVAVEFGAEGIGLCRTEHMFFSEERITAVREMILANSMDARRVALAKLLPMQRDDFVGIFRAMGERPVTIRLLDPPLHEFLPQHEDEIAELAPKLGVSVADLSRKVETLREFNPMLGHRGCRLGISFPEIYEMQVTAIIEAACDVVETHGLKNIHPEIMIPLVGMASELALLREICDRRAHEVIAARGVTVPVVIGTMIELPRACVVADDVAAHADFFSFGTNDLTQTALGISRDDAGRFLPDYVEKGVLPEDPFVSIDPGVAVLMEMAVSKGRAVKPGLKIGICGEHGGEPRSVEICHRMGLDYVSCSPYRVPIARLAAAQASIRSAS